MGVRRVEFLRHLMSSMYSLSFPLLSLHLRYMTEASTLAGEKVLGSFRSEITLSRMVLREVNTEKGEGLEHGNTGGASEAEVRRDQRYETAGQRGERRWTERRVGEGERVELSHTQSNCSTLRSKLIYISFTSSVL